MRVRMTPMIVGIALVCMATAAAAAPYEVVSGRFQDADHGEPEAITGSFEITPFASSDDALTLPSALQIEDFAIEVEGEALGPRMPVEFDGDRALDLRIADHIQFDGETVTFVFFQAGGELISSDDSQVGFRFYEFRGEAPGAGGFSGGMGEDPLPRRIVLRGVVSEIDQFYRRPPEQCPMLVPHRPTPPIPDGGVIVSNQLRAAPVTLQLAAAVPSLPPSLEELGIVAPDGAVVRYEGSELVISTPGDLFISGAVWALPGVTGVRIDAGGDVVIDGALELPPGVFLQIETQGSLSGDLDVDELGPEIVPGDGTIGTPPGGLLLCDSLLPIFPVASRELGSFVLELSASPLRVEIDVRPRRVVPKRRRAVWVVLHGSDELDVASIELRSLRLGRGEASIWTRGRSRPRYRDVDRDGYTDLIVRFPVRPAAIQSGDEAVCLLGATTEGLALEGCDEIETSPRRARRGHR